VFLVLTLRPDADSDGYCLGASFSQCSGSTAPTGTRLSTACQASDDCGDADASRWVIASTRADADGDTFCVGASTTQCAGNAALAGTRLATSCQGDDCRDTNSNATTACYLSGAYLTTSATKQCGIGFPAVEAKTVPPGSCPAGFSRVLAPYLGFYSGNSGGTCAATSDTTLNMGCGSLVFGSFSCSIQGDCSAD
jgi:hypothetical protein